MLRPHFAVVLLAFALFACNENHGKKTVIASAPPAPAENAQPAVTTPAARTGSETTPKSGPSGTTPKDEAQQGGDVDETDLSQTKLLPESSIRKPAPSQIDEQSELQEPPSSAAAVPAPGKNVSPAPQSGAGAVSAPSTTGGTSPQAPSAKSTQAPAKTAAMADSAPKTIVAEDTKKTSSPKESSNPEETQAPAETIKKAGEKAVNPLEKASRVQLVRSETKPDQCTVRAPRHSNRRQDPGVLIEDLLGLFSDEGTTDVQRRSIAWYLQVKSVDDVEKVLKDQLKPDKSGLTPEVWVANYDKCEDMAKFARLLEVTVFKEWPSLECQIAGPHSEPILFTNRIYLDRSSGKLTAEITQNGQSPGKETLMGSIPVVLKQSSSATCPISFSGVNTAADAQGIRRYRLCLRNWDSPKPGELGQSVNSALSFETSDKKRKFLNWLSFCSH